MAKYHFLVTNTQPKTVTQLQEEFYSVGRDQMNEIVLPSSTISRHHAHFLRKAVADDYEYELVDGNPKGKPSHNGVYINQERSQVHRLANGDIISFGGTIDALYFVSNYELDTEALAQMINFEGPANRSIDMNPNEFTTIML